MKTSAKKVVVYSTPSCPYCYTLKEFLKEKNVAFEEVDVLSDEKAREDMIERSGQMSVPVLEVDGKMIIGFDKKEIVKSLEIKE